MLALIPDLSWYEWAGVGLAIFVVWAILAALGWYLFLEYFDKRDARTRAIDRLEEDKDQAAYLREWARTHGAPAFTPADKAFLKGLQSMVPDSGEGPKMLLLEARELAKAYQLRPGGFALVRGDYSLVEAYFRYRGWERLPFLWRDRHIYRKPK
jgi:hypothetical protein